MLKLIIAVILPCVIAADLLRLEARNSSDFTLTSFIALTLAPYGDIIATTDNGVFTVLREVDGRYVKIAEDKTGATLLNSPLNNGQWLGIASQSISQDQGLVVLFQLDSNDTLVNKTELPIDNIPPTLLSDSTLVYYNSTEGSFMSHAYSESDSKWISGPSFSAPDFHSLVLPRIYDNTIIYMNNESMVLICTRQEDGSWIQTDSFVYNASEIMNYEVQNMFFNGLDTMVFSVSQNIDTPGFLAFYTKVNNEWQLDQIMTPEETGTSSIPNLLVLINTNTFVASVLSAMSAPGVTNSANILQRRSGQWQLVATVSSGDLLDFGYNEAVTQNYVIFGAAVSTNAAQSFFPTTNFGLFTLPLCLFQDFGVTCNSQELPSCDVDPLNVTNIYTLNSPQCSDFVQVSTQNVTFNNDTRTLTASLAFSQDLAQNIVTCQSQVTCPVQGTPITPSASPVAGPDAMPDSPVALGMPPSSATTPSKATSPRSAVSSASFTALAGTAGLLAVAALL